MLLLIDNYDSFTFNLYQYLGEIYPQIKVVRNDELTLDEIARLDPQGIILSPGPGRPENAGICVDIVKYFGNKIPILGICLGHQAIGYAYGGSIISAEEIRHGKTSRIRNDGELIFKGLSRELSVMRYHSLVIDKMSLPEELEVTSENSEGTIMSVRHKSFPVHGLQFHPESVLTEGGKALLRNFVEVICNVK